MRASVIIAAHNEGQNLSRTIASCIDTTFGLDCEIVVADDASVDGSVETAISRFPHIQVQRHEHRLGVSPTRAMGAKFARGEVLLFLDGHTKPERDSLRHLMEDVERTGGEAIVTPRLAALDVRRWESDIEQVGDGYGLDLWTLECKWLPLRDLRPALENWRRLYESPALIGAVVAVGRELYAKLWGFDPHMRYWGVEDLDLGLKCWLMGNRILHDAEALVGHRFRTDFDNYVVPPEYVLMNQLRLARKAFTHSVWADWLNSCRDEHSDTLADNPEGVWARAWHLLEGNRASVEQERVYLQGNRVRDEFWYAERFGLAWPRLQSHFAAGGRGSISGLAPSASPSAAPPRTRFSLAPSVGPSILPPRRLIGITPNSVTLIIGQTKSFTAQGTLLNNVQWTAPEGTPESGTGAIFSTMWDSFGRKTVTATTQSGERKIAVAVVVSIVGVLTAHRDPAIQDRRRFNVGELIDLSFRSSPPATAEQLGGVKWVIAAGGGTLSAADTNDGCGLYRTSDLPGSAELSLEIVSGPNAGRIVATCTIMVDGPKDKREASRTTNEETGKKALPIRRRPAPKKGRS
jgi:glycosyltransferase involved in cell wall biosynthesis